MTKTIINILILLVFIFIQPTQQQNQIAAITVSLNPNIVNTPTSTYTFTMRRDYTGPNIANLNEGALMGVNDAIVIQFPSKFTALGATYVCSSVITNTADISTTCTNSCMKSGGNNLTISGCFNSIAVRRVVVTVINVNNPIPNMISTGVFKGYIGSNYTLPSADSSLTPDTMTLCEVTFSPAYINKLQNMIINVTPKNTVPAGGLLRITFPNQNSWTGTNASQSYGITSSMVCSSSIAPLMSSCTGDTSNKIITATNLFPSDQSNGFTLQINSLWSPPLTSNNDKITLTTMSGSYNIDTCSVSVSNLLPNILAASLSSTSQLTVNTAVPITFLLNSNYAIFNNQYNQYNCSITFPSSSFQPSTPSVSSYYNLQTLYVSGSTVNFKILYNATTSTQFGFVFSSYKLPNSIEPITIQLNIIFSNSIVQTVNLNLTPVPSVLSFTITPISKIVNVNTIYQFIISIKDSLTANGIISFTFPSDIELATSSSCATLIGTNVSSSPTCTRTGQIVQITPIGTSMIDQQSLTVRISGVINPKSTKPTSNIQITTYYNSMTTKVSSGTSGPIISIANTLQISSVQITPSDKTVKKSSTTYKISFINFNPIPVNGYIIVGIPPTISASTSVSDINSRCYYSINSTTLASTSCTATSNSSGIFINFNSFFGLGILSNSNITLEITNSFTNPSSTKPTQSFKITTLTSQNYEIDKISSGVPVFMTIPAAFKSISGSHVSKVNSQVTTYEFVLNQESQIETGGYAIITFPGTIVPQSSLTCADSTDSPLDCSSSGQNVNIKLPITAPNTNVRIKLIGIKNSFSRKPNDPIIVNTYTIDNYRQSQDLNTINITNNIDSSFSSIIPSFSPRIYGQTTKMTITLIPTYQNLDRIVITLATDFTIGTLQCENYQGITGGNCASSSNTITLTGTFATSGNIKFTVSGITAAKSQSSYFSRVQTYFDGYSVDQISNIQFTTFCTNPCRTCSVSNLSACDTCYSDTSITASIYFDSQNKMCRQNCLPGFFKDTLLFTCNPCDVSCLTCVNTASNCSSCNTASNKPYRHGISNTFSCLGSCPSGYYPDTTNFICIACSGGCATCINQTACLSCITNVPQYKYWSSNFSCLFFCPSQISIQQGLICLPCDIVCKTCQDLVSNCTSCSDDTAYYNGKCVTQCPDPYVIIAGSCGSCSNPCSTCSIRATNCTSCNPASATPLLLNYQCKASCPTTYYNIAPTGVCLPCSDHPELNCNYCKYNSTISTVVCSPTCDFNFIYYDVNQACLSTVPFGYINISNEAKKCANQCQTCQGTQINCTSCTGQYSLYNNNCISPCPSGTISINHICQNCIPPCRTCVGSVTTCESCLSTTPQTYLNGHQCKQNCPTITFPNQTSLRCQNCQNNCQTCQTSQKCLSCLSGFYFYLNTCKNTCPTGFIGLANNCQKCDDQCLSCSGSTVNCTSCHINFYFIQTSSTCSLTCPTDLYPYSNNMSCIPCMNPCQTCSLIPTNCTSCLTGNLLLDRCYDSCPDSYYSHSSKCIPCPQGCGTCVSALICNNCINGWYLYQSTCVSTCPYNAPVTSSNGLCNPCSTVNCSRCSSTDSCYQCVGTYLVHKNECIENCPTNYQSNTTFCLMTKAAQQLADSLSSSSIVPVPFTLAGIFIVIVAIFSKFIYQPTFFMGSVYAVVSILQCGALICFIILFWIQYNSFNIIFILAIAALGSLYLINIASAITNNIIFSKDMKFKNWFKTGNGCISYTIFSILSLLISFKLINIVFSKLFNAKIFKAKLQHHTRLFCVHLMSLLSLPHSVLAVAATAYYLAEGKYVKNSMLFFVSIDVIILTVIEIILGLFNARKQENFFEEQEGDPSKVQIENDSIDQLKQALGLQIQFQKGAKGRYKIQRNQSGQSSLNSQMEFIQEQTEGANAMPSNRLKQTQDANVKGLNKYQQALQGSQFGDSSRNIFEKGGSARNLNKQKLNNIVFVDMGKTYQNNGNESDLNSNKQQSLSNSNMIPSRDSLKQSKEKIRSKRGKQDSTNTKPIKSNFKIMPQSFMSLQQTNKIQDSIQQSIHASPIQSSPFTHDNLASKQSRKISSKQQTSPSKLNKQKTNSPQKSSSPNKSSQKSPQKSSNLINKSQVPLNKQPRNNNQLQDFSGISQQGRQNIMTLKNELQNKQIKQQMLKNNLNDPQKHNKLNQNILFKVDKNDASIIQSPQQKLNKSKGKDKGKDKFNQNKQISKQQLIDDKKQINDLKSEKQSNLKSGGDRYQQLVLQQSQMDENEMEIIKNGIKNPFKNVNLNKVEQINSFGFSENESMDQNNQRKRLPSSTDGNTIDKSADEIDEDINKQPAYITYNKMYEPQSPSPFSFVRKSISNQNLLNNLGNNVNNRSNENNGSNGQRKKTTNFVDFQFNEEDVFQGQSRILTFPEDDQLSKQIQKFQTKQQSNPRKNSQQSSILNTDNDRNLFMRPVTLAHQQPQHPLPSQPFSYQKQQPLSYQRRSYDRYNSASSLNKNNLAQRPQYSSASRINQKSKPKKQTQQTIRNHELQRIYLQQFNKK